jgi:rhodanese-related sulfurtransferase/plastocyanin
MRGLFRIFGLAAALCSLAIASRAGDSRPAPVKLIPPQRLIERIQAGEKIVFLDVRQPEEFAPEHIPGAVNIPKGDLVARQAELARDAIIIPYCNMDFRGFVAARELEGMGFQVALMQERGLQGWQAQKLPVAGTKTGLSDAEGLEKVRTTAPADLLGERFVSRVAASGKSRQVPVTVREWYFEPNQLEVQAGEEVHIAVTSAQGEHYFILPDYEVQVKIPQGETREVVFVADRAGEYRFGTCEWDGSALQVMKGQLRVRAAAAPAD